MIPNMPTIVLPLLGGRDLGFAEYGNREGVPVFAFHGTPGSNRQMAPLDAAAQAVGVRLIAMDRPCGCRKCVRARDEQRRLLGSEHATPGWRVEAGVDV